MQAKTERSGELMSARHPRFTDSANRLAPYFAAGVAAAQDPETQFLVSVADFLFSPWATFWGCCGVTRVFRVS